MSEVQSSAPIRQATPSLDLSERRAFHPGAACFPAATGALMPLPQPEGAMAKPMTFELVGGGRLMASGTITPGIFKDFAAESRQARRLHQDDRVELARRLGHRRMAMGRLIREKKFRTEVEAGKYCASSCPLVFAGGIERKAGDKP